MPYYYIIVLLLYTRDTLKGLMIFKSCFTVGPRYCPCTLNSSTSFSDDWGSRQVVQPLITFMLQTVSYNSAPKLSKHKSAFHLFLVPFSKKETFHVAEEGASPHESTMWVMVNGYFITLYLLLAAFRVTVRTSNSSSVTDLQDQFRPSWLLCLQPDRHCKWALHMPTPPHSPLLYSSWPFPFLDVYRKCPA